MLEANVTRIIVDVNWVSAIGTLIQAIAAVVAYYVARSAKKIAEQQKDITEKQREIVEQQTEILQTQINLALYQSLMTLIGTALRNGTLTNEDITEFWRSSKEAEFLLDDELNSYIQEVQRRCNIFVTLSKTEPKTSGQEMHDWVIKMDKEKAYFLSYF